MSNTVLKELEQIEDPVKKRAIFIGILSREIVRLGGKPPVVVGGEAVELYTQGSYTTGDIDIKSPKTITEDILKDWGFVKKERSWSNNSLDIYIDWLGESLDEGSDAEKRVVTLIIADKYEVRIVSIEDLIIDRLNAFKWWKDEDSFMWAKVLIQVKAKMQEALDLDYLNKRAKDEDIEELFNEVVK